MKWQEELVKEMSGVELGGIKYVRRADVLELLRRRCGVCAHYVEGEKLSMGKCISPTYTSVGGWRWCAASDAACKKWERRREG